ncbi:GDSL-type esterase/lipase family protein [Salibacterium halotolerans]|uniref:GDSL-like Lipase/Acylhydrolase n=1 Tax=Salibacterium halotolerans TaxID=1884432 RepID=A0A1I5QRF6_9BACI|nr:GDSL-type esterase/lipase family protein [Salibacterium halotolerans]SFP48812.1 GDSL-like Lipase/Acylhydrolase [Salibacterium halotolerans]
MKKKIFLSLLMIIFAIFTAACGDQQKEKDNVSQGESQNESQNDSSHGESQASSFYDNSLFYGDSILKGLPDNLDDDHVISSKGATTQFAMENVNKIVDQAPESIYMLLGSNDLLMPVDHPVENSMKYYKKFIKKIKKKLPDTQIHVLSVTPVTQATLKNEPRYKDIPKYNKRLQKMASQVKVDYIDLSPLFEKHQNLHAENGVHFKSKFDSLLLSYIQKQ